jgi:hypothetical protein
MWSLSWGSQGSNGSNEGLTPIVAPRATNIQPHPIPKPFPLLLITERQVPISLFSRQILWSLSPCAPCLFLLLFSLLAEPSHLFYFMVQSPFLFLCFRSAQQPPVLSLAEQPSVMCHLWPRTGPTAAIGFCPYRGRAPPFRVSPLVLTFTALAKWVIPFLISYFISPAVWAVCRAEPVPLHRWLLFCLVLMALCALVHGYHSVPVRQSLGPRSLFLGRAGPLCARAKPRASKILVGCGVIMLAWLPPVVLIRYDYCHCLFWAGLQIRFTLALTDWLSSPLTQCKFLFEAAAAWCHFSLSGRLWVRLLVTVHNNVMIRSW